MEQTDLNLANISIYPIITNKLVCVGSMIPHLKYQNGGLNKKFMPEENEKINKYSNNIDLLISDIYYSNEKNKNTPMDDYFYNSVKEYLD